jgi:hypothetical protein
MLQRSGAKIKGGEFGEEGRFTMGQNKVQIPNPASSPNTYRFNLFCPASKPPVEG